MRNRARRRRARIRIHRRQQNPSKANPLLFGIFRCIQIHRRQQNPSKANPLLFGILRHIRIRRRKQNPSKVNPSLFVNSKASVTTTNASEVSVTTVTTTNAILTTSTIHKSTCITVCAWYPMSIRLRHACSIRFPRQGRMSSRPRRQPHQLPSHRRPSRPGDCGV
jgi:hypothetical protein